MKPHLFKELKSDWRGLLTEIVMLVLALIILASLAHTHKN